MIIKRDKNKERQKRKLRVRGKISGSAERPRLNVYRSASHIYAQLVDDGKGATLAAASTLDKKLKAKLKGLNKTRAAEVVGADIAAKALAKGIKTAVFDRGGYLYTGRVKAVAESARAAGLKF